MPSECTATPTDTGLSLEAFHSVDGAFAVLGLKMRIHKGRSVVMVTVEGRTHYLKRFWLAPSRLFKRSVARGLHEMRMIDWLNDNGFAGPRIVRRGVDGVWAIRTRVFFLMEEVPGELPLEATCRRYPDDVPALLRALASFAARLHDAGFHHTDFSERHLLIGRSADAWTFRLIDLERAHLGKVDHARAAADLATLTASADDERLREQIKTVFLDEYLAARTTLPQRIDFRSLLVRAIPTRPFS